jgi:hypothetical protein
MVSQCPVFFRSSRSLISPCSANCQHLPHCRPSRPGGLAARTGCGFALLAGNRQKYCNYIFLCDRHIQIACVMSVNSEDEARTIMPIFKDNAIQSGNTLHMLLRTPLRLAPAMGNSFVPTSFRKLAYNLTTGLFLISAWRGNGSRHRPKLSGH